MKKETATKFTKIYPVPRAKCVGGGYIPTREGAYKFYDPISECYYVAIVQNYNAAFGYPADDERGVGRSLITFVAAMGTDPHQTTMDDSGYDDEDGYDDGGDHGTLVVPHTPQEIEANPSLISLYW